MNLERIFRGVPAALLLAGLCSEQCTTLQAQQESLKTPRQQRSNLEAPELRVKPVDPKLEQVLSDWHKATTKIQKLQGKHYRWVYDRVFEVEKRADGMFYYEAPDKGRIDIEGSKNLKAAKNQKVGKKGDPYKIEPATPEKWISDGKEIKAINDGEKTVEIIPIPKEAQGPNIMDGPLPFLFGMPPEKAKRRYDLEIVGETKDVIVIRVHPKLPQDAKNWSVAHVMLDRRKFLPVGVKIEDPAGNMETVYKFDEMEVNRKQNLWQNLTEMTCSTRNSADTADIDTGRPPAFPERINSFAKETRYVPGTVPSVLNMPARQAEDLLKKAGYEVAFEPGETAPQKEVAHTVYEQQPKAGSPLGENKTVRIIYYKNVRTSAKPPTSEESPRN
jgi:TIGR03009 family protein